MTYVVVLLRRSQKELQDLQSGDYERVRDSIARRAGDPRPSGCIKLAGREGWRMRVGNYRVIYSIDDARFLVTITRVGNRRDICQ